MTKQDILNTTGLSEEEFYQRYPDQETFCSEYPEMCPDMMDDNYDEDIDNYQNLGYDEDEISMAAYGGSLYKAQSGVEQDPTKQPWSPTNRVGIRPPTKYEYVYEQPKTREEKENQKLEEKYKASYTYNDRDKYQEAIKKYDKDRADLNQYSNFQNELYNLAGIKRNPGGFNGETAKDQSDIFNNKLSPEQQDELAKKYNFDFVTDKQTKNENNYLYGNYMNLPGKGGGYYSFPRNPYYYGSQSLEKPIFNPATLNSIKTGQYQMPETSPVNFQGKPINYQPGTATINLGNTNQQSKLNSLQSIRPNFQPTQIINNVGASYKDPASLNASNGNLPIPKHSLNSTMKKVGATNQPFVTSTPSYSSIVDLLKARKLDSSFANRKKLAEEIGIKNYTGSASQNMDFINRMDDFNPYSTEMELGGENMFVNGGLVKYKNKGEVKQNPPKEFTDFKKFQRAERLYKDSLQAYNVTQNLYKQGLKGSIDNVPVNPAAGITYLKREEAILSDYNRYKNAGINIPISIIRQRYDDIDKGGIAKTAAVGYHVFKRKNNDGTFKIADYVYPKQPVVFKPALTHPIEHLERLEMISPSLNSSNIQIKLQTIPMKPMKLKQRGTTPFYGPGRTLIGFTGDDRQFYPGEYTGAPNNQMNLQDKYLLDHPELLKEYLKKIDTYKVDNFELGGVNIHPAMRTNFKQGGLIKYQKKGEVKMKYGDFMNFVENPEMIQVDGMRSHYEPETNTIFYDTPRSIPDELGHAVQRANRNIGYSVPPNNNTMMRQLPEMQYVYPIDRENLDPFWVNENAGALNTIREINVPNNSNNSLSRTYVNKFFPGDKFGGNSYLKKLNDSNIYFVPGSGEYEAHQLIEPRIREDFFNYNKPQYKQGGYYGMDGRLHRAKGSGTYVMNGGYYFQDGGGAPVASPATPPGAIGDPAAVPQSSLVDNNMPNPDGTFNVNNDYDYYGGYNEDDAEDYGGFQTQNERALKRQARRQERRNTQYETPDLGGLDESQYEEQPEEEVTAEPFDASNYSSAIDPSTGFTKWSKNNQALTNIKKQDPALWGQLKDEGKGARFRTGQTDIQKVGRAAGKVGATLDAAINVAGAFGNLIDNQNEQRNLNNAAINQGSTASIYKNPQGASKGDYGQTGSSYGMTNPISVGARSFKGMYGKYGMQVPKYDIGGGFSNLFPSAQSVIPINNPISLMPPSVSFTDNSGFNLFQNNKPIVESTGVYQNNQTGNYDEPTDNDSKNSMVNNIDVDAALQTIAGFETGSKPGESKPGLRTKIIGEGGKRASASGTFQITLGTLKDIYKNDKNISSKYETFNEFKSAYDKDGKVEYEAAKSLMSRHIKNYGIYALGAWYYPEFARRAASGDKSVFDIVPRRDFGNNVKWGDDVDRKLKAYNKITGSNYTLNTTFNAPKTTKTSAVTSTKKPVVNNYTPSNTNFSLKGLINFAKTNKWVVTSTTGGKHNPGSRHKKSRAIDVSVKNKTPQQILDFMKLARSQGYRVLDERVRPKGQKEWHGAHLHLDFKKGGQFGGQVMEMDEDEITQFLKAGGQLEFLD